VSEWYEFMRFGQIMVLKIDYDNVKTPKKSHLTSFYDVLKDYVIENLPSN